jgi:hypothetical protein
MFYSSYRPISQLRSNARSRPRLDARFGASAKQFLGDSITQRRAGSHHPPTLCSGFAVYSSQSSPLNIQLLFCLPLSDTRQAYQVLVCLRINSAQLFVDPANMVNPVHTDTSFF